MYIQGKFNEENRQILHALIDAHPLGALVVLGRDGLEVNHMPFFLDADCGEQGLLRAHMPKASPLWPDFCMPGVEAVVIFQGAERYITPSWYASKQAHGQAVPTWNYAVVHAYGTPTFHTDAQWLRAHVTELTNRHEAAQAEPWQVSDAPADYIEGMLGRIIGIELRITRLLGKWKVSQNRSLADRLGVEAGLTRQGSDESLAMAALVRSAAPTRET